MHLVLKLQAHAVELAAQTLDVVQLAGKRRGPITVAVAPAFEQQITAHAPRAEGLELGEQPLPAPGELSAMLERGIDHGLLAPQALTHR
jgi:hypothetical protein